MKIIFQQQIILIKRQHLQLILKHHQHVGSFLFLFNSNFLFPSFILATIHTHTELYSKTVSPKTPSPIHTTVTCSQVWERLASNEEHQNPISPKPNITPTTSTSSLPTHISFSYDLSDNDEEGEDLPNDDKYEFQYVPVSSQSKLVQFQFLTFARQQLLTLNNDDDEEKEDNTIITQNMQEDEEEEDDNGDDDDEEEEQEVRCGITYLE
jgi:hypothetical protein